MATAKSQCELASAGICQNIQPIGDSEACRSCGIRRGGRWRNTRGFSLLETTDIANRRTAVFEFVPVKPLASLIVDYVAIGTFESGDVVDAVDQFYDCFTSTILQTWTTPVRLNDGNVQPTKLFLVRYVGWTKNNDLITTESAIEPYTGDFGRDSNGRNQPRKRLRSWKKDQDVRFWPIDGRIRGRYPHVLNYDDNGWHRAFDEYVGGMSAADDYESVRLSLL